MNKGSLLEDFTPPVNPDPEIDDPDDVKPENWDEREKILDPDAKKPEDWDEDAPPKIVDSSAKKPDDWLEDEPLMIPDPDAEKPEDWCGSEHRSREKGEIFFTTVIIGKFQGFRHGRRVGSSAGGKSRVRERERLRTVGASADRQPGLQGQVGPAVDQQP